MQSKTSFFDPTIFWKNVKRFWPLWGAYLAVWCIMPIAVLTNGRYAHLDRLDFREGLLELARIAGPLGGAVVAVLMAMLVWGFLYNARSAHGMAVLPLRREGLFLTEMLSGLAPLLAANLVIAALTALAGLSIGALDLGAVAEWFAVVSLILVFFYGFATLCAQLTGHIVVLPLVYGVLNFVFAGAEYLLREVFSNFVYGMYIPYVNYYQLTTRFLSPVFGYLSAVDLDYTRAPDTMERLSVRLTGWGTIAAYALVGVVMLTAALLLFRRRKIEAAGDVVAVKALKPVFRWCMALGCALVVSVLLYAVFFSSGRYDLRVAFVWMLVFLVLGAFIGWFAAEMLMKKTFRVFRVKQWAGLGVCCAVILAMMLGMRFDLFGYERRVPDASRIDSVIVRANGEVVWLTSQEDVELVRRLHRQIIEDREWNASYRGYTTVYSNTAGWVNCIIDYWLDNDSNVQRAYQLRYDLGERGWGDLKEGSRGEIAALNALMNTPDAIRSRKATNFPFTRDNIYYGNVSAVLSASQCAREAGRESPEEYILCDILGWTGDEATAMDPEMRDRILAEAIFGRAYNGDAIYREAVGRDVADVERDLDYEEMVGLLARNLDRVDYDRVYFDYNFSFEPAEVWQLYNECILPDLAEGTLGRVWIVSDQEYYDTVYRARIEIGAREPDGDSAAVGTTPGGYDYIHSSFYTVPTVNSYRANRWLTAHGVPLYTEGELDGVYQ